MMFLRSPIKYADLMNQWLALDIMLDPNAPEEIVKDHSVCSVHFTEDDYFEKMEFASRTMKSVLKDTAIPSIAETGQSGSPVSVSLCFYMTSLL